jgi:hypothetical protein
MSSVYHTELSSHEGTRCQFNGGRCAIKSAEGRIGLVCGLGIDVHQDFYVVVMQEAPVIPNRRSVLPKKRSCSGQLNLNRAACKCMPSMKRAGLGFLCNGG